ncbi:SAM-dependent DNA methyltransferase [Erwinia psidii]|uniref:N-6 DNA methylase n=1 Tax=Erwinia psidii TaxID=69224 RepID=UPI00226B4CD0|nr:N-6 DNA methylase [Erwinia psidii]MCX8967026.1 SAM-dependent DNA methyltransferase [Erwinia psidii]
MNGIVTHQKAFISLFNQTARYHKRHRVFEDFISCGVIALENRLRFCQKREQKYLNIISRYEKPDVERLAQLLAHVVDGLDAGPCDFLGSVFMSLEMGDAGRGQYFTPWDVASLMAQLQLCDIKAKLQRQPFITLNEPACGSGCMVLAFANALREAGLSPHRHLWVSATDVDPLAAGMAYIQLSLCGIAGEVVIGNSLANERRRVLHTPVHYFENWPVRLNGRVQAA